MPRGTSIYDGAQLANRLWTPNQDVVKNGFWLDASQKVTVASGVISQWDDVFGNWSFTQSNSSLRPSYNSIGWDKNAPTQNVTATTQKLVSTANFTPLSNTSGFTAFHALDFTAATGWFWEQGSASPADRCGFVVISNQFYFVINSNVAVHPTTFTTNTRYIVTTRFDGTKTSTERLLIRVNSNSFTATGPTTTSALATTLPLGFGPDPTSATGNIRDLIILPYAASDSLINLMEGYLYWKLGRRTENPTADFPYINRPPLIGDN